MDRHTAESLDRYLTTPPEQDEPEELDEYREEVKRLCDEADLALENEYADRQTILENLIDQLRSM